MRYLTYSLFLTAILAVGINCNDNSIEMPVPINQLSLDHDTLVAGYIDSIPLTVTDITSNNNQVFVLDGPGASVIVLEENDIIKRFGQSGSGPGEFGWPLFITSLSDSIILISDITGLHEYNSDGHWIRRVYEYYSNPMMFLESIDCSTFVAYKHDIYVDDGQTTCGLSISSYDLLGHLQCSFYSDTFAIDLDDPTAFLDRSLFACHYTAGNGRVFLYNRSTPNYAVYCYDSSGNHIYSITRRTERRVLTADEIAARSIQVESYLRGMGMGESDVVECEYCPKPWAEPISDMWVTDETDQLWVQRGDLDDVAFDIYQASDGRFLRQLSTELRSSDINYQSIFVQDSAAIYIVTESADFSQSLLLFSRETSLRN